MAFENAKFEQGVAQTMATLARLSDALAKIGSTTGLSKIEAEANKVTLSGPMSAIEKLQEKLHFPRAAAAFQTLETFGDKVTFGGLSRTIDSIKAKLHFPEAKAAFGEIEAQSGQVKLAPLNNAIEESASRFSILEGAAAVAFGNISAMATMAAGRWAKDMTLGPIMQGYEEYGQKLTSIRTIMSSTGEGINPVTRALQELNHYSDKTIYSFRDMTSNLPKFTNAGVALEPAVKAIQGISQVAALSGASTEEAAHSMYNLGQAIGQGYVALRDWRSVEIANMGTKQFKEELIKTAEAMGHLKRNTEGQLVTAKGTVVTATNFTATLQDQWLKADALTKTLAKYTDEQTALGKRAFEAATEVKTLSQLMGIFKEQLGSGWAESFELIFGNLKEATKLWGTVNQVIGGFIAKNQDARNAMLKGWRDDGGAKAFFEGLGNIFEGLISVLSPIRDAFRDIFPRQTAATLISLSESFRDLTANLKLSQPTMDLVQRTFRGLFAVLDIGWEITKKVIGVIADLLGVVGDGSGGFLSVTAAIGDWLYAVDQAITKGEALTGIFESLSAVLSVPLEIIKELGAALVELFTGDEAPKAEGVATAMDRLNESLKPLRGVLDDVMLGWEKFKTVLENVRDAVEPGFTKVLEFLGGFGQMIADKFSSINWDNALLAIQTGLIGGIFLKLKNGLAGLINFDVGGELIKNLNEGLGALTANLKAMQRSIQVATLLQISAAILLLAAGVLILSKIPADQLQKAMGAVAIGLAQLVGAMVLLSKVGTSGFAAMPFIAASMVLLATSLVILAAAMKIMSTMDWEGLAKGLIGVGGALTAVAGATNLMHGPKLLAAGLALIPLAIGLNLLAVAVRMFGQQNWEELGRGLFGVFAALGAVAMGVMLMPPSLILIGPGLVAVAFGITILAGAVSAFGSMDLKTMVQGLLGVGAAVAGLGYAIALMPPTIALQAAGLLILAVALNGIAAAVGLMGNLDIGTLVKGLIAMGLSLQILAFGLTSMIGTLPGSVALLAAAAAFAILGPAIAFMGQLKWGTLLKGLVAMALALTVLAVAGTLAAAPITALGTALGILGLGMLAISAALSLFVLALAQLGDQGPKAIAAMVAAFGAFLLILPKLIIDFIKGLVVIVAEIVKIAPQIAQSLVMIAGTLLDAIISLAPKVAEAIAALVTLIAQVLTENVPVLVAAGFALLIGLLTGIRDGLPQVMTLATDIIVSFLQGLADNAPRIIQAGVDMLVKFIEGIDSHLAGIVEIVAKMITTFLDSVTSHIPSVIKSAANMIVKFLNKIAEHIPRYIAAGVTLVVSFIRGVGDAIPRLVKAGLDLARRFLNGIADGLAGLADIGFKAVIRFLNGIEKAIRENFDDLVNAGIGIADALIDGITEQFGKMAGPLRSAVEAVFDLLPGWAKKILGISSPSKVFAEIGKQTMLGYILGIEESRSAMKSSMDQAANNVVNAARSSFGDMPDLLKGVMDMDPVITPVLDLSQVERDAAKIGDISDNVVPISAAASYDQASATSQEVSAAQRAAAEAAGAQGGISFSFEQNNTSPKALDDIEIYRQTKNQLSQVKQGLGLVS